MTLRELAPWRWGGLRPWRAEEHPVESLRREMLTLHHDMDRMFEDFWNDGGHKPLSREFWGTGGLETHINETEDDEAYHIVFELPGMDEND